MRLHAAGCVLGSVLAAACSPSPSGPAEPTRSVVGLNMSQQELVVPRNATATLRATAVFSNGATEDVSTASVWTAADPAVARVAGGMVTAAGIGRTVVRAEYSGQSATATVIARRNTAAAAVMQAICPLPNTAILNGLEALVDGTLVKRIVLNDYIGTKSLSLALSGLSMAPGDHELRLTVIRVGFQAVRLTLNRHRTRDRLTVLRVSVQQSASVSPSPFRSDPGPVITLSDADTGETLSTMKLPAQEIVMQEYGGFSWNFAVPIFER